MKELNKIYLQDCMDGMKDIENKSIDLVVCDPPYSMSQNSNWLRSEDKQKKWNVTSKYAKSALFNYDGDIYKNMSTFGEKEINELLDLLLPKMKIPNAYFFCSEEQVPYYGMYSKKHDLHFQILVWEKPLSIINKNRFSTNVEYLVRIYDFGTALNRLEGHNEFYNKVVHTKVVTNKKHPTQKPVDMIARFILLSSNEGDVVLDPFMGSGTTAIACIRTNRKYIGFEKEEKFYNIAMKRIDSEARQLSLF